MIPVNSVSAEIVTTPFLLGPETTIEPSGSLVKVERLVALMALGSRTSQRLTIDGAFSFSQSAIFLARTVLSYALRSASSFAVASAFLRFSSASLGACCFLKGGERRLGRRRWPPGAGVRVPGD